jgi:hypothetical protein
MIEAIIAIRAMLTSRESQGPPLQAPVQAGKSEIQQPQAAQLLPPTDYLVPFLSTVTRVSRPITADTALIILVNLQVPQVAQAGSPGTQQLLVVQLLPPHDHLVPSLSTVTRVFRPITADTALITLVNLQVPRAAQAESPETQQLRVAQVPPQQDLQALSHHIAIEVIQGTTLTPVLSCRRVQVLLAVRAQVVQAPVGTLETLLARVLQAARLQVLPALCQTFATKTTE